MDDSLLCLESMFGISKWFESASTLIAFLVQGALISICCSALRQALHTSDINEDQARRLFEILAQIDPVTTYSEAMEGELVFGLEAYAELRGELPRGTQVQTQPEMGLSDRIRRLRIARPLLYADELVFIREMRRRLAELYKPYRMLTESERRTEPRLPWYASVARMLLPVTGRSAAFRDEAAANVLGSRIFLALLAGKARLGAYPDTLRELREKLAWDIPLDPFTGEEFMYRRRGEGFLLYSVGVNLRDDGGVPPQSPLERFEKGDIVWSREA